jgi:predicted DsbA family dithiol-disulfide isomerase
MTIRLKVDFVSDVACPWCAIGLHALEQALERIEDVEADIHFQPFELNPQMPPEGQDMVEHITGKYGITEEQAESNWEAIRARGDALGFEFRKRRDRIYNTFDAHRLLYWAADEGRQHALKHALLRAYFTNGENSASHDVLVRVAGEAGLDPQRAREILSSDQYVEETREQERLYLDQGIHSVPSVIINDRYLIQGGQPVEAFEQALRKIAVTEP